MGDLANKYSEFKLKYNMASKINNNIEIFIQERKEMIQILKARITKEERELYHLIEVGNL